MFFTSLLETNLKYKNFFNKIIYYSSTKSTNEDIWNSYKDSPQKYLVITDNQIAGKGRGVNTWYSIINKSITCSFILEQVYSDKLFNFHSLIIPLAIQRGVKKYLSIDLKIKWPNDIMYKNFKVGGVLIETKKYSQKYIFNIGIGINVNEDLNDFKDNLQNSAVSLKIIKGYNIQREPLLGYILNELHTITNNYTINKIRNLWLNSCNHINKNIIFKHQNKIVNGIFKNINEYGQAVIKHNKDLINYDGEIRLL